jgi:dienelactone hydrolase
VAQDARRTPAAVPDALRLDHEPVHPRAAVLLLHGGRADGLAPPSWLNLPGRRMRPFGRAVRRQLPGDVVLIGSVRYRRRGWNGRAADPVDDARRALDALAGRVPDVPVVLVGHSMGGRAALAVAAHPAVAGVVALAPWCPPGEPVAHLSGRSVVLLHDERDRITSAAHTWAFARRAAAAGARVGTVAMPYGGHTMLRGARAWHRLTVDATAAVLTGAPLCLAGAAAGDDGDPEARGFRQDPHRMR